MMKLERGFKSWSERLSAGIRRDLDLPPHAPLPPSVLAEYLGVRLLTPQAIPGLSPGDLRQLIEGDPWGWSAVNQVVDGRITVIYNPRHSPGRQASNVAHELAHVLLEHEAGRIILSHDGGIAMRTYDEQQEAEAGWLSGCLLLPRVALLLGIRAGSSPGDLAAEYGVSEPLVNYRFRITGVAIQHRRMKRGATRRTVQRSS